MVLECRYKDQGRGKGRRDGKDWKRKRQQGNRVENTETKGLPASTWYEVWTSITLIPLWSRRACWTKVCARWGESLPPLSVTHQGQQRASQRAGLTRWEGWCCTCLGPLSWIEKTEEKSDFRRGKCTSGRGGHCVNERPEAAKDPEGRFRGRGDTEQEVGATCRPRWSCDRRSRRVPDPLPRRGQVPTLGAMNLILTRVLGLSWSIKID